MFDHAGDRSWLKESGLLLLSLPITANIHSPSGKPKHMLPSKRWWKRSVTGSLKDAPDTFQSFQELKMRTNNEEEELKGKGQAPSSKGIHSRSYKIMPYPSLTVPLTGLCLLSIYKHLRLIHFTESLIKDWRWWKDIEKCSKWGQRKHTFLL